ncbi:MAG TPA: GNAT family N-acetyltransferase [Arenimonas sp.]|nr:GNAT family N-acetyltransferase [Arenimonas sp.]HOZ05732.1 GNAT family N-acetyltransferase [Arenimonas sp.]HPO24024.1 GNAT family N-acetyltransferase [Arenimonas sp.]HPW31719.1 GNAT family N-acetyltransferase [Arenimonas sp.]
MLIRDASASDFERILQLNEESVHFLSPLTLARLETLHAEAAYHRVIDQNGEIAGFLLAFREGTNYDSSNYVWFTERYEHFLYVDRIVVSKDFQGRGIGNMLYDDLFEFARNIGVTWVTCEFDIDPPNDASRRFHERFGFSEVGTRSYGEVVKQVSLQMVAV